MVRLIQPIGAGWIYLPLIAVCFCPGRRPVFIQATHYTGSLLRFLKSTEIKCPKPPALSPAGLAPQVSMFSPNEHRTSGSFSWEFLLWGRTFLPPANGFDFNEKHKIPDHFLESFSFGGEYFYHLQIGFIIKTLGAGLGLGHLEVSCLNDKESRELCVCSFIKSTSCGELP